MLGDLSDFIAPTQACVNPLFTSPTGTASVGAPPSLVYEASPSLIRAVPAELPPPNAPSSSASAADAAAASPSTARVSLADCLACAGCVTSAETVLIEAQSGAEFFRALADPLISGVVVVFAPQSLAALAAALGLRGGSVEAYARAATFLRSRFPAVRAVVDTAAAADVALAVVADEFIGRLAGAGADGGALDNPAAAAKAAWQAPPPSIAVSAGVEQRVVDSGGGASVGGDVRSAPPVAARVHDDACVPLPLLASACPGWVCYAEKSAREAVPLLSAARSPLALAGAVLKAMCPPGVYVLAVMPCYDKKLEAARRDFESAGSAVRDVDCVLAVTEFIELAAGVVEREGGPSLAEAEPEALAAGALYGGSTRAGADAWARAESLLRGLSAAPAGAASQTLSLAGVAIEGLESDGFLPAVYRAAERILTGVNAAPTEKVRLSAGRNSDAREAVLVVPRRALRALSAAHAGGERDFGALARACAEAVAACSDAPAGAPVALTFSIAYGFRNIQGVLSRLKRAAAGAVSHTTPQKVFVFAEVMACPSGCVNGGGLPRAEAPADTPPALALVAVADAARERISVVTNLVNSRALSENEPLAVAAALRRAMMQRRVDADAAAGGGATETSTAVSWAALTRTHFHAVAPLEGESLGLAMANKW